MKERPILFSGDMVRAILSGAKTQTRRPATKHADPFDDFVSLPPLGLRPPCAPGDIAWVRETWAAFTTPHPEYGDCDLIDWCPPSAMRTEERWVELANVVYAADKENSPAKWRPSIHMPRWASRITLPLVEVRVERVQAITEADARAEGVDDLMGDGTIDGPEVYSIAKGLGCSYEDARAGFGALWAATYGRESWDANPWVWVLRWEKAEVRK